MDPDREPSLRREAFICPMPTCGVYARQLWRQIYERADGSMRTLHDWMLAECTACQMPSIWRGDAMIFPLSHQGEAPHADMPDDVLAIYEEARGVSGVSRKSAAGLLRLALQMLVDDLEPGNGTIDTKIGKLVAKGLDPQVQQAMDVLRVVGNESVHPGQIDLDGDDELLPGLFNLVNVIVEQVVSRPKVIGGLFAKLPEGKRDAIQRRDGTSP